jgi:hypothetical protein
MKSLGHALKWLFASAIVLSSIPAFAHSAADEMALAANNLLTALTPEQKTKATFDFPNEERQNWHFIPKARKGLPIKEMTHFQRPLAFALLASGLSHSAFMKAGTIMSLEEVLRELEAPNGRMVRDPELHYVTIFGTPSTNSTWGWRVEGHHLSINFTLVDGQKISATPCFLGDNPAEVKSGPRQGLRVLAAEEDLGRQLVKALDAEQKKTGIFKAEAPGDIITMAERKVKPLETVGLPASKLNATQRELLTKLIKEYIYRERSELADQDWQKIEKAGFDKIYFGWAGGLERGDKHYYRVQGPTFLLEYDNTQNNANHIHSVWRDFEHDFGVDLLAEHYKNAAH